MGSPFLTIAEAWSHLWSCSDDAEDTAVPLDTTESRLLPGRLALRINCPFLEKLNSLHASGGIQFSCRKEITNSIEMCTLFHYNIWEGHNRQHAYKYQIFSFLLVVQYVAVHLTFKMHFTCQAEVFDTVQHKAIQWEWSWPTAWSTKKEKAGGENQYIPLQLALLPNR